MALTLVLISHQISISTVFSPSFWIKLPSGSSVVYLLLGTGLSTYATLMRHIAPKSLLENKPRKLYLTGASNNAQGDPSHSITPFTFLPAHTQRHPSSSSQNVCNYVLDRGGGFSGFHCQVFSAQILVNVVENICFTAFSLESVSAILALKGECNSQGFYLNLCSFNEKLKINELCQQL